MHMKMTILRLLVQLLVACSLSHAALMRLMRDWPRDLDGIYDNSSVIVAGSVIQLFCSASGQFTAPYIQWTWNNITIPETAQLPHLMVNSWTENNTITSSVLTIYGFSTSDNGSYQCNACDNGSSDVSQSLLLTAINGSNVLRIIRELNNNIGPDRTSVPLGSSNISSSGSFLRCSAQQPPSSSLTAPSMIWLKDGTQLSGDGVRVVITTTNSTGTSNRTTSYVRIFNFRQSDAGVYQCVFYDTPSQGGEVITTRPYRVDTGPVTLKYLSPSSISLCPPEPLVIQVEAGGEYAGIQWTRTPIALNVSSDELVDFQQTFVRTVTSEEDWGLYTVNLVLPTNVTSNITVNVTVNVTLMTGEPVIPPAGEPTSTQSSAFVSTPGPTPHFSIPTTTPSSTPSSTPNTIPSTSPYLPSPVPSVAPLSLIGGGGLVVMALAISVPGCVLTILLILVASLLAGMAAVRCWWWKREDVLSVTNPVCLGMKASPNTSDSSSDGRWSLERGHAHQHGPLHDEGSLEHDHTYEALSSLPPRQQPIFEDLPDLPDHFAVMNQGVDVGGYSAVGPTINGSRDVFPTLVDAAKYDEPVCMMMGMGRRSPHPPCPIEDGIAQFNPQLSSSPWSPPNIDLNWYQSPP